MKFFTRSFYKLRRLYRRFFHPISLGVRGLLVNESREILLIKHTYCSGWHLPGGKVNKGESLLSGVIREVWEETGINCNSDSVSLFGIYTNFIELKYDYVSVFLCTNWDSSKLGSKKSIEIEEARLFSIDDLPVDTTPGTRRRILEYKKVASISDEW